MDSKSKVSAKDFFLWVGAMATLYWSVVSFLILIFEYINRLFPDPLTSLYTDPYSANIRFAMASLIVLAPTALILLRIIRNDISLHNEKAGLWIRKWALMLTLFVAGGTVAVDLIVLINTFLGGEVTSRFLLKVLIVLLVAVAGFLHFLADLRGYWVMYPKRSQVVSVAIGTLTLLTVGAGFFIVGSPNEIRLFRYDAQKEEDLSSIQWRIINYWEQKEKLPENLAELSDPISGFSVPADPQTGDEYEYSVTGELSFELCANFNMASISMRDSKRSVLMDNKWVHDEGYKCFERVIDPERYPTVPKLSR